MPRRPQPGPHLRLYMVPLAVNGAAPILLLLTPRLPITTITPSKNKSLTLTNLLTTLLLSRTPLP